MDINKKIAEELNVKLWQVEKTVELIEAGSTIPFIARYRKEVTGNLDDVQLRQLEKSLNYMRNLEGRKEEVKRLIEEQGKLDDKLIQSIEKADSLQKIEDIYAPFKKKKRTRATIAKEKGLEPLASYLFEQNDTPYIFLEYVKSFISEDKEVLNIEDAIVGAQDILAEILSERVDLKDIIRKTAINEGIIKSEVKKNITESVYEMYYDYEEQIKSIPAHRVLAIKRGEKEKVLKVKLIWDDFKIVSRFKEILIRNNDFSGNKYLINSIEDSYKRLMKPAIEREYRTQMAENAEERAIQVFADNTKPLLLQAPVKGNVIMGIDPGYRTGCKIAIIDETGKYLDHATIYPTKPKSDIAGSKNKMNEFISKYSVTLIVIGNGTGSRETEMVVAEMIKEGELNIFYTITSEAGASVYSASALANEEFPNLDVSIRGAISIARRVQDPLAELVKIEPKAIGVGQYQHDVNQKNLETTLHNVVEDCVNHVGVDLNTASQSLLGYVSGVSKSIAKEIVKYRDDKGIFKNRKELLKVKKLGDKAFEQCAGFLRLPESEHWLDRTGVHPESYELAEKILNKLDIPKEILFNGGILDIENKIIKYISNKQEKPKSKIGDLSDLKNAFNQKNNTISKENAFKLFASEIDIGIYTLNDIVDELKKPGRDPRENMPKPIFKSDVLKMEDLKEGMLLNGTVRNVIDFGAFVDIGVKQDGLVHISEISDKFVKHPSQVVSVGDEVKVWIKEVDLKRKRIALSMKSKESK